jgi:hypothetical protein
MQPYIPRRRSRRRSISGRLIFLICGLVVTALVVGGVTQISRQSGSYDATLNGSFAALGTSAATQSNVTAVEFRSLMTHLATESRPTLEVQLDNLVQQSAGEEKLADSAVASPALSRAQSELATAFRERASAMVAVRRALNGLLGLDPLPAVGSLNDSGSSVTTPTLVSSSDAALTMARAGAQLIQSDEDYRSVRQTLRRVHATLPRSVWVANAQAWQAGAVDATVDQLAASPVLAALHRLVLGTVRLTPQVLPAVNGANAVLPPTRSLAVTAVLTNLGTVDEPRAAVEFTMTPELGGPSSGPVTTTRTVPLGMGDSEVLAPVTFKVKPGHQYQLTVAVVLPPGQADVTQTSQTDDLQVAPST